MGEVGKVFRIYILRWFWFLGIILGLYDFESRRFFRVGVLGFRVCLFYFGFGFE